ncbi:MAG: hypothetical protein A3G93_07920 [Nitrospinae bacterium RIFCSPLOWO2_12_FULL_45_22]|nr:MAG: hypothetical protein A3G93_07920 [Nitrospinae bacterium RIFCSPLOWO2_12_FULL_45_22]
MKRVVRFIKILLLAASLVMINVLPAKASLWDAPVDPGDYTGSRTSASGGGVYATQSWDNGGFTISWDITNNNDGTLTYKYTLTGEKKSISHFILELSGDIEGDIFDGSDPYQGPASWGPGHGNSNPGFPEGAAIYGIKFEFGGSPVTYTLVTNRLPVWGNFYAKDGKESGDFLFAYNNALALTGFNSDVENDFIARPNSIVPLPGSMVLFGTALVGLLVYGRGKFKPQRYRLL